MHVLTAWRPKVMCLNIFWVELWKTCQEIVIILKEEQQVQSPHFLETLFFFHLSPVVHETSHKGYFLFSANNFSALNFIPIPFTKSEFSSNLSLKFPFSDLPSSLSFLFHIMLDNMSFHPSLQSLNYFPAIIIPFQSQFNSSSVLVLICLCKENETKSIFKTDTTAKEDTKMKEDYLWRT